MSHDPCLEEVWFQSPPGMFHVLRLSPDPSLKRHVFCEIDRTGGWWGGNRNAQSKAVGRAVGRGMGGEWVLQSAPGKLGKEGMLAKIVLCVWLLDKSIVLVPDGCLEGGRTGRLVSADAKILSPIGGEFVGPACRHVLWMSMMRHGHLRCRQGICVAYVRILHGKIPDRACPFSELGAFGPFVFTETEVRAPPLHASRHTLTMQKNVGRRHDAATASGTQSRQGQTPPVQSTHPCQCARTGQSACQTCAYPIQTPDDQVNLTDHLYPDWRRALRAASHACRMFIGAVGSFRAFLNFR